MGSDWGTHGEESYPEAAWLQLEVFGFLMLMQMLFSFQFSPSGSSWRFLVSLSKFAFLELQFWFSPAEGFWFYFQSSPSCNFKVIFFLRRIPKRHFGAWTVSTQHCKRSSEYLPLMNIYVIILIFIIYYHLYLYIFNIANNQMTICTWSYIQPVILGTSTQSWLKEHFEIFFQKRNEEGRGGGRAIPIPTNVRTGEQPRRTTRVLDKIYLGIYIQYIQHISKPHYMMWLVCLFFFRDVCIRYIFLIIICTIST